MTIPPFHEPVILKMPLEAYAETAFIGGVWLVGEILAQQPGGTDVFLPNPANIHMPRERGAAIAALSELDEARRLCMFFMGFLALPYNGAQETFRQLLLTHTGMLNEALRIEWSRRLAKVESANVVTDSAMAVAKQLLPKLLSSR
ncbi:MAG: hypothetical protein ACREEK_17045 [Bradyrhizobium sp.]